MKLTDMHVFDKARVVAKTLGIQVCLFVGLLVLVWGSQAFYGVIDTKKFPQAYTVGETANLSENDKGKLLVIPSPISCAARWAPPSAGP